jgi:hypothetical protein
MKTNHRRDIPGKCRRVTRGKWCACGTCYKRRYKKFHRGLSYYQELGKKFPSKARRNLLGDINLKEQLIEEQLIDLD